MIAGCYVVHVYCDSELHDSSSFCSFKQLHEFTGETYREAWKKAREYGWSTKKVDGKTIQLCKQCLEGGLY